MLARTLLLGMTLLVSTLSANAQTPRWLTTWAASVQGPYPIGNPSAQPEMRFAFPDPAVGAKDQTFRLIAQPSLWGSSTRVRLSNALGTKPVTFDTVAIALQRSGSVIEPGSSQAILFAGKPSLTLAPGEMAWSDAVALPFAKTAPDQNMLGRRLAVSFHVAGESGPMTWHAKAVTTSYVTRQGAGAKSTSDGVMDFPFSTASWYFLDAIDMQTSADAALIVAFGDSITDGTASTLNGNDRWSDVLLQRLHAAGFYNTAIANEGIGGNQVVGPASYTPQTPFAGGPSALDRLDRDVLSLSGVTSLIWLEGINDLSTAGNFKAEQVIEGMKKGVARLRAKFPAIKITGATATTALASTNAAHGSPEQDVQRKLVNDFIRKGGLFDAVADFDAATLDTVTGQMKPEFVPESTTGGPGDKLHPNRAGYQAMAATIDLKALGPK